ncbi:hypothetical protein [Streptomyces sp. XY006]|uniref:hypothetical protein n=1 Tax=Streptomyces sp. XY006 TaxID=2021410 RepID=UPI000B8C13D7|nr:hypothetical protein [Streptomyces sp. XY006]OXS30778.1 hypothetical protein CHR28_34845 [Streptomyces sp. XY006]
MTSRTSPPGDGDGDDGSAAEPPPLVCARCGTPAGTPGATPPPTWTFSVEHGVSRYFCASCARENLRSIEGRLDSDWW